MIDFVNEFYQFSKNLQEKYVDYCDNVLSCITDDNIAKIENTKKLYGILEKDTFNIFEPLKNYQREDFNEIILTQILNPKTKEIGNIKFLNIFCKLLSEKVDYSFGNDVAVKNQIGNMGYGFIDILIFDKKNAIIVESKINGAPDMPNQLARYFRYVENNLQKKVLAVVYIRPIYDDQKMPPLKTYEAEYASETARIKNVLVPVSIIDGKRKKDLCHTFLDACSDITTNEKARVYIQQYSELLKISGGNKMLTNVEKEMLKKLCSDDESVKKLQMIGEIWDNRWEILASIIKDVLYQKGFGPVGNDERCTAKSIDEKISIVFTDFENDDLGFGFWYNKGTSKKTQESLENLLNNYKNKLLRGNAENTENQFICKILDIKFDRSINDIVNTLEKMYEELAKMTIDELK
jgi:hypothetical protein